MLEAPHIAEADDTKMTRIEGEMARLESEVRSTLTALEVGVRTENVQTLKVAAEALDRFLGLNAQLVALSRRNTNVRSLAMSLGQKRTLASACEYSLRALDEKLAKRTFPATR